MILLHIHDNSLPGAGVAAILLSATLEEIDDFFVALVTCDVTDKVGDFSFMPALSLLLHLHVNN